MAKNSSEIIPLSPPSSPTIQLQVNQKFARVYEERKRKEELTALEKRGIDTSDDYSSSETEDEGGEALTKEIDADINKTLKLIRKKDPAIYDPSITFFKNVESNSSDEDKSKRTKTTMKSSTPLYYKDLVRQQVIAGDVSGSEEDEECEPIRTYQEEQDQIKKDFLASLKEKDQENEENNLDGGLFTIRKKADGEERQEDEKFSEDFLEYEFKSKQEEVDPDKFLEHYLSSEGWKEKSAIVPHYDEIVKEDEEDAEELEKAEDFEHTYNFRFEEQGSSVIQTYSRRIEDTMRREDDSRKRKRAERKERKALERQKKEEELRRLKNLKQAEIERKLTKIAHLMGEPDGTASLKPEDLEGDFDPEEYDKRMQAVFDDQYYDEDDDMEKPTWDEEEDKDLFGDLPVDPDEEVEESVEEKIQKEGGSIDEQTEDVEEEAPPKQLTAEEMRREKQKYLDELYGLDYEDLIGDMKCRFKYRQVQNNDFGLTVDEIMAADDKELKQLISLKRMAPYADKEYSVDRKRLKNLKKSIKKAQQEHRRRKAKKEVVKAEEDILQKKRKRKKSTKVETEEDEAAPEADACDARVRSKTRNGDDVKSTAEKHGSKLNKRKRRSKKKIDEKKNLFASTGLPTSRLESYKLVKSSTA
ncbi:putative KRR1 interacting protein [Plasmopara halstedii]